MTCFILLYWCNEDNWVTSNVNSQCVQTFSGMFQKLHEDSKENIFRVLWDSTVKISQGFEDSSRMSRGLHKQQGYFEVSIWWFIEKCSRIQRGYNQFWGFKLSKFFRGSEDSSKIFRGLKETMKTFEILNWRFFEDFRGWKKSMRRYFEVLIWGFIEDGRNNLDILRS